MCLERLLIAARTSVGFYNASVFVVLCDEICSCENEMQFATEMEKDDVSVVVDCTFADIYDNIEC